MKLHCTCSSLSAFVLQFSKAWLGLGFSIAVQLVTIATCSMYVYVRVQMYSIINVYLGWAPHFAVKLKRSLWINEEKLLELVIWNIGGEMTNNLRHKGRWYRRAVETAEQREEILQRFWVMQWWPKRRVTEGLARIFHLQLTSQARPTMISMHANIFKL